MMFVEQASFPIVALIQDAPPPISPALLIIIAILLVILFIWLLLRERAAREDAAARRVKMAEPAATEPAAREPAPMTAAPMEPSAPARPAAKPVEVPNPAMRSASFETPMVETPAAPRVDDLEIIEGIGPKIASLLNQAGVTSFAQLAAMEPARISEILHGANLRLADPTSWPEQARLAANGDKAGLQALQDRLKGGR